MSSGCWDVSTLKRAVFRNFECCLRVVQRAAARFREALADADRRRRVTAISPVAKSPNKTSRTLTIPQTVQMATERPPDIAGAH